MKCFYHSADLDGKASAAIVGMKHPDCELIGINFGDEFPWDSIEMEPVYMVDFCLQPFSDMERLNEMCNLIWIDHHKSAIEEADAVGFEPYFQVLEVGLGACALVWDYMYPQRDMPESVRLLAEYDVWNHTDERTLPFQFGMRLFECLPDDAEFWLNIFNSDISEIISHGTVVLTYQGQQNEQYSDFCAFDTELDGLKCIAINRLITNSQMFEYVWDEGVYDAMLTFGWRKGQWTVSLYSTKGDIDVSEIAKNRGGGGHKGAAGFQCLELPFELR